MTTNQTRDGIFEKVARHRFQFLIAICFLGILGDQASKIWAQNSLAESYEISEKVMIDGDAINIKRKIYYPTRVIQVVPDFLNLIYKENPAAAFSLTSSIPHWIRRPMLIVISIIATMFFLFWYFRMKALDGLLLGSFGFILAGALGNLIDRIRLGYVIDFIDVNAGFLGYPHVHWPTFNMADSLIVIGAIGVIIRTLWPIQPVSAADGLANDGNKDPAEDNKAHSH